MRFSPAAAAVAAGAAIAAAALAAGLAPARGAALPGAGRLSASVKLVECSLAEHAAVFRGRMNRVAGSERMGMRFTLLERTGAEGFRARKVPGLGRWRRSKPGVVTFGYRQEVRNLTDNATYRMRVDFRWYAPEGGTVRRTRRYSRSCRQFAALPNLRARLAGAAPTKVAGVVRYTVHVTNAGDAEVSGVPVRLTVDEDVVDTLTLRTLVAGERGTLWFPGPQCTRTVEARADPDGAIVESDEDDNADLAACADLPRR